MTDEVFKDFNSINWNTWETFYALNSFGAFCKENEQIIANAANDEQLKHGPKWRPSQGDDEGISEYYAEIRAARYLHDEIMVPNFRYAAIVMLYTLFEREVTRLVRNIEKDRGKSVINSKELKGRFLEQKSRYLDAFYSLNFKNLEEYKKITDFQKVRDCIVHCFGNVELSRDREHLIKYGKSQTGIDTYKMGQMDIHQEYIDDSIRLIWRFFLRIFESLSWKINSKWLTNQWTQ